MGFFRTSFKDFGETLRTVSLVIGLVITSFTGVGYIYTLISDQKALAVEVNNHEQRITAIESDTPIKQVNRHRLTTLEESVAKQNEKIDRILDTVQNIREDVARIK